MQNDIPDLNLFMMCQSLSESAISELPPGYHLRNCRKDELDIWKAMPFDNEETAIEYNDFMTEFFDSVYAPKGDLFFDTCIFVCDYRDRPVGTCFAWQAYDAITTIHWWKVLKEYEGQGIGRALLSHVMKNIRNYPVFLHTQPGSFRAIKLYSDFGFSLLFDETVGYRKNDLSECMPILQAVMPEQYFNALTISKAPDFFLKAVASSTINQF